MSEFRIATTSGGLASSNSLLSTILAGYDKQYEPEWLFNPQSGYAEIPNGGRFEIGKPIAVWRWGALRFEQRQLLKAFCTGLSTLVYIKTATNETSSGARVFDTYSAWMNWTDQPELIGINYTEQVEIIFTGLIEL